jgi:C1A family cysteine protease
MYSGALFLISLIFLSSSAICQQASEETREVFQEFEKFLQQFNKTYTNMTEFTLKYQAFKKNFFIREQLRNQEKRNADNTTEIDSSFGDTEFMDVDPEEFQKGYLRFNISEIPEQTEKYFENDVEEDDDEEIDGEEELVEEEKKNLRFLEDKDQQVEQSRRKKLPKNWDWRVKGAVNPVQNQGTCGGCWAFSAIANLEGQYFKKHGVLPKFSEQQLIDCDPYNNGCGGGIMHNAFSYVKQAGIAEQMNYPYQEYKGYCRYNTGFGVDAVKGYRFAGSESEAKIKRMLYEVGPLAITINASNLQYYNGGIINLPYDYCPYNPTHGVNLVGYGKTAMGQKYWIVRNTWGPYWGEGGYFRIARGTGLCGINKYVITAVLN